MECKKIGMISTNKICFTFIIYIHVSTFCIVKVIVFVSVSAVCAIKAIIKNKVFDIPKFLGV